MRFLFIVQGEGKGHLMQSVALREILEDHGHEVIKVLLGRNPRGKPVSDNLYLNTPPTATSTAGFFLSPFFITLKNRKGINLGLTFLVNIILIPVYLFESVRIALIIRKQKPDAVINFYDIVGGISSILIGPGIRKYVISHHFFFEHPDFNWPANRTFEKKLLLLHSRITSFAADKKLALSFTSTINIPGEKLFIIPPLLRKKIRNAKTKNRSHIHVYTLNPGYFREIENWCKQNPAIQINMFTDFRNDTFSYQPNLKLYSLSGEDFFQSIISCAAVACTSGFETLAEAAYLGKALQVVPTENHFEQYCNAKDLERAGLGVSRNNFMPFIDFSKENTHDNSVFKDWVKKGDKIIISYLCPEF